VVGQQGRVEVHAVGHHHEVGLLAPLQTAELVLLCSATHTHAHKHTPRYHCAHHTRDSTHVPAWR
jgi:hypothetical protein